MIRNKTIPSERLAQPTSSPEQTRPVRRCATFAASALVAVLAILAASSTASATLLLYEPFDYSGGGINGQSGASEFGLSGAWQDDVPLESGTFGNQGTVSLSNDGVSLVHPGLQAGIGSRVADSGTDGGKALRDLSGFSINNNSDSTYYVSALIQGSGMVQFEGGSFTRAVMGISDSGSFIFGQRNGDSGSTTTYDSGSKSFNTATTYLLVGRINTTTANPDSYALKIYDPTMAIDATEPASFDLTDTGTSGIDNTRISLAFFSGTPGQIDEIRVGETWADVTPAVVPEPSAIALGVLAFLGLGVFAWRRRRPAAA